MPSSTIVELPPDVEKAVADLLQLPPKQRLEVSRRLEASFSQEEIDGAWSDEIAKRIREIESGSVRGIPTDEVFREIEERLGEKF
jgi:hypothetical protein